MSRHVSGSPIRLPGNHAASLALSVALLGPWTHLGAAEDSGAYYAAVSAEVDDEDSSNLLGEFGLPLGRRGWMHLGLGSSTATLGSLQVDTTLASVNVGFDAERFGVEGGYAYRKDSDSFEQHDLRAGLRLLMARGQIGLDLFHRTAEDETVTSIERRRLDPLAIRIVEAVAGSGIGLNGAVDMTPRLRLFASGMTYDYDSDIEGPAFLARFPRLALRLSSVTREEAYLDNTMRIGATYRFDACSLTARYIRDEELDSAEITDTIEIAADISLGAQWALAPWIGQSSNQLDGDIAFGGVHISVIW